MLILLAGIHGAGKGVLGHYVEDKLPIKHLSASQLISSYSQNPDWSSDKRVGNLSNNQQMLISAVNRERLIWENILLDGHAALREKKGGIGFVDADIFKKIGVDAIVLIEESPRKVAERLHERDNVYWNLSEIEELAEYERIGCREVSQSLKIPLKLLFRPKPMKFLQVLKELLGRKVFVEKFPK